MDNKIKRLPDAELEVMKAVWAAQMCIRDRYRTQNTEKTEKHRPPRTVRCAAACVPLTDSEEIVQFPAVPPKPELRTIIITYLRQ